METSVAAQVPIRRAGMGNVAALALIGQAAFLETFASVLDDAAITEPAAGAFAAPEAVALSIQAGVYWETAPINSIAPTPACEAAEPRCPCHG